MFSMLDGRRVNILDGWIRLSGKDGVLVIFCCMAVSCAINITKDDATHVFLFTLALAGFCLLLLRSIRISDIAPRELARTIAYLALTALLSIATSLFIHGLLSIALTAAFLRLTSKEEWRDDPVARSR